RDDGLELATRGAIDDVVVVVGHHRVDAAVHQHLGGRGVVADVHHRDALEIAEALGDHHGEVADRLDLVDEQDDALPRTGLLGGLRGGEQSDEQCDGLHRISFEETGSATTGGLSTRTFFLLSLTAFHFAFPASRARTLATTPSRAASAASTRYSSKGSHCRRRPGRQWAGRPD